MNRGVDQNGPNLAWIDLMKGIALLWVFANHCTDQIPGSPFFGNPTVYWSTFAARFGQLMPLTGHGLLADISLNILRYVGWFGEEGVQLFLILSGFGLTWGLFRKGEKAQIAGWPFYKRRAARIYPLWWALHGIVFFPLLLAGRLNPDESSFWLSFLGFRATTETLYTLNPAWWYVGLLIQLYLVYPFLWRTLQSKGPTWLLVASCMLAFPVKAIGLYYFESYRVAWCIGSIFITRLPEFVFGMALASWMWHSPVQVEQRLCARSTVGAAVICYLGGTLLAITLLGLAVSNFLLGVSAFVLLFAPLRKLAGSDSIVSRALHWIGRHSYSLYLVHYFFVWLLLSEGPGLSVSRVVFGVFAAFFLSALFSVFLERFVERTQKFVSQIASSIGKTKFAAIGACAVLVFALSLGCAELYVRESDPQETMGWGERPALIPDADFGWRLIPNRTTRLRWESYDYVTTANALGFPGPEYPVEKQRGGLRIMTTGDAFTSAEGVNTNQAWPRLLEDELRARPYSLPVQVLNFAMTGYGPPQYASVLEHFVPMFHPDIIIVEMFVNDYEDAMVRLSELQRGIGFQLPPQNGWRSYVRLSNLREYVLQKIVRPVFARISSRPTYENGFFLGNYAALQRDGVVASARAQGRVKDCLLRMRQVADSSGSHLLVVLVPASIQVCSADQLDYYLKSVDLSDTSEYDLSLPQRVTEQITHDLGIAYLDVRRAFVGEGHRQLYQRRNMHLTPEGQKVLADIIGASIVHQGLTSSGESSN